jgi:hypothetical protein
MMFRQSQRSKVLWLGASPQPEHQIEHANRGLTLCEVPLDNFQRDGLDLVHARGLVLCAMPPKVSAVTAVLDCVVQALNHGLYVVIMLADSLAHGFVQQQLERHLPKGPARDRVQYRVRPSAPEVAEIFARHVPGHAINRALQIHKTDDLVLTEPQGFLLQRAFADCVSVTLSTLAGGRSALTVLVQATLSNSMAGPHPLPFFAKLDAAARIVTERDCYERYADSHIAWNLRPNLQSARCLVGTELGILVGSFVTKSEPLWTLILQGRAGGAITSLFKETLAGWRDPAAALQTETGSIAPALCGVFAYQNVRKRYLRAAAQLGVVREPQAVWEAFLNLPTRSWRKAPVHGDMHADNVRVRGDDAIMIDLARVTLGPPSADPACMEVWIAFQRPPAHHAVDEGEWLATVRDLFDIRHVLAPPASDPAAPLAWLRQGVLQTRQVASASSPPIDYAITLALYLLRRAMFEPDAEAPQADEVRRTWAWILGCQLLEGVQALSHEYREAA